jgi:hypothetical protein
MPHAKRTPLPLRELKASMILKDLSLRDVADLSKVNYSVVSAILLGTRIDPKNLAKIERVITAAKLPKEAA